MGTGNNAGQPIRKTDTGQMYEVLKSRLRRRIRWAQRTLKERPGIELYAVQASRK